MAIKKISTLSKNLYEGFKQMKPEDMKKRMDKTIKDDEKKVEKDKVRYKKDLKTEKKRFENLACPVCKSLNKKQNTIYERRSEPVVYGGRNAPSKVLSDYCVCQDCGVMFVDINKKEVQPAYGGMFNFLDNHYC